MQARFLQLVFVKLLSFKTNQLINLIVEPKF